MNGRNWVPALMERVMGVAHQHQSFQMVAVIGRKERMRHRVTAHRLQGSPEGLPEDVCPKPKMSPLEGLGRENARERNS